MSAIWGQFTGYFRDGLEAIAGVLDFLGGHRWAAAIIVLTLIVRTLILPLAIKQIRSMREQQRLQPEVQRLRQKYRNDRQAQTQAMMELYQREGVNPYAACLPLLLQMPILFAMYSVVRSVKPGPEGMPFLGLGDLADKASGSVAGWVLIVIMTIAQLVSTRQLNPGQTDQQRRMQMLMPLMFLFFFINVPAALVLYYATQTLYQLVQQIMMTRDMRDGPWYQGLIPWPGGKKPPKKKAPVSKKATSVTPAPAPVVAGGSPMGSTGPPNRRDIDEKRRRRRRKKKRRKR